MRPRTSTQAPVVGLTQKDVATLLGISERAVRNIEKRALAKLGKHPVMRELWDEYQALLAADSALGESDAGLTPAEIRALWGLTRTTGERFLLRKLLSTLGPRNSLALDRWCARARRLCQ